ncbi:MAG TPA: hypothetical protein VHZ52_06050 [Acidobacteriaceae bacterium]|jgi:hypothetical protein|nr:hypothetical protein [Acidobacteriaceae bacterium]
MNAARTDDRVSITVCRWLNSYVVDDAALLRDSAFRGAIDQIDRRVVEELPARCGLRMQQALGEFDDQVWRIRRLDLSFVMDLTAPQGREIAQPWSERIVTRILDVVEDGAEMDGVLRFPNRAVYQARFARDVALGHAWGKWYYEEFQSLANLSPGRAIAEMLAGAPQHGMRTMLHLAQSGDLEMVLTVLTRGDARTIFRSCFSKESNAESGELDSISSGELSRWSGLFLVLLNELPMREAGGKQGDQREALRWISAAALRYPGAEHEPAAYAALSGLLELRRVLGAFGSAIAADRLVCDLVGQRISIDEAIATAWKAGAESPENALRFLARIADGDSDWAAQAAASLNSVSIKPYPSETAFDDESTITRFGGIFLLGPTLVELQLKEVAEAVAGDDEQNHDRAAALRHLVLAKCLGRPRALEALSDSALRLFSGCCSRQRTIAPDGLRFAADHLAGARAVFVEKLIMLFGCEGRFLLAEAIHAPGRQEEVLLLRDLSLDLWLCASALPIDAEGRERGLLSAIDFVRSYTGSLPYVLLAGSLAVFGQRLLPGKCAAGFLPMDGEEASGEAIETLTRIGCISHSLSQEKIARLLASSQAEFSYYSFCDLWPECEIELDLISALLSRTTMKGFARRLMGFQSASAEYIYRNFLEGVGTVHDRRDCIEVEMPRSPFSLVLQLSGLTKQKFTLPWLKEREVCLLPPQE